MQWCRFKTTFNVTAFTPLEIIFDIAQGNFNKHKRRQIIKASTMKTNKIIQLFFLISLFGSANIMAKDSMSGNSATFSDTYGIIDAVYPEEMRLVINDMSIEYRRDSSFFKANGDDITRIKRTLPKGTPVIYQLAKKSSFIFLRGLKIISMREYKNSQRNDDH